MIEELLEYYRGIQSHIAEDHHGEYVLIHGSEIVGFYRTTKDAYWYAVDDKNYVPGSFLIRECLSPAEEKPLMFYSRLR